MRFDIRLPIGLMFLLIGALLVSYGLFTTPVDVDRSAGYNVNAWWGGLMTLFGLAMLGLARRARRL
jgi:hypothetical protein